MGTPSFAVPVLAALPAAGHDVAAVYGQPDRPAGRGRRPQAPPVIRYAVEAGLPVFQPPSLRPAAVQRELAAHSAEVIVVAGYGLLLPAAVLDLPPLGCLNVHPSLLPRYRGPSPVASAILNGDDVTGVTIMRLDEGVDTGPILACRQTPVGPREDTPGLTERLFEMGAALLVEVLPRWAGGDLEARPQAEADATLTAKLAKSDGEIDWDLAAVRIERQVRAYRPWPGSFTRWRGRLLRVVEASAVVAGDAGPSAPGTVVPLAGGRLGVAAGEGVVEVHRLQLEGRSASTAREFAQGYRDFAGSTLGR